MAIDSVSTVGASPPVQGHHPDPDNRRSSSRRQEPETGDIEAFGRLVSSVDGDSPLATDPHGLDQPQELTQKRIDDWSIEMSVNAIFNNRIEVEKEQW